MVARFYLYRSGKPYAIVQPNGFEILGGPIAPRVDRDVPTRGIPRTWLVSGLAVVLLIAAGAVLRMRRRRNAV